MIDDALGDEVRVTVIAAGFDGGMPKRRDEGSARGRKPAQKAQTQEETLRRGPGHRRAARSQHGAAQRASRAGDGRRRAVPVVGARQRPAAPAGAAPRPTFDDDELDVPDFLK